MSEVVLLDNLAGVLREIHMDVIMSVFDVHSQVPRTYAFICHFKE